MWNMIPYGLLSVRYTFRILATLEECAAGRSAAPSVQVGQDLLRGRAGPGREPVAGWAETKEEDAGGRQGDAHRLKGR
ncbi:hypothetical protein Aab01nite_40760 [Paractinoplanes abujensis]|nr:hypothetical protein Aab01nite_40760 [Actinoplanes abujensis]